MEVTTFCIPLLMNVLVLLVAHIQHGYPQTTVSDAAFRIVPTRLQLFEYESVHFTCEGFNVSAGCRVRTIKEFIPKCSNDIITSTVTCTIDFAFQSDSGEYWCEAGGGKRSNTVNVTVTDGRLIGSSPTGNLTIESVFKSHDGRYKCNIPGAGESPESRLAVRGADVIMESPALPVTEREAVTLRCRTKEAPSDLPAGFYKDGLIIRSSSTGEMTIQIVSKSDEGLYKCRISGAGESPESWLAVRAPHRETCLCSDHFIYVLLILRTVFTIVMVALLLLLVGLLHSGKLRVKHK
ncbi:uncharacterized protein LOC114546080 isoform X2 [Perca flavescens]|uniref:uncharacterized protein LOC114546080 isoform X2 n=1 Tax=Perca flavescens TaxID=8167 RepID=UPI00106E7072|nr:uncharacterized protein LOC114546080 isoform X2 [Perca flavescens]